MGNECLCRWRLRLPLGRRRWVDPRWHKSLRLELDQELDDVLELPPGPVIGGQAYILPPMSTEEWEKKKRILFDDKTGRVWPNAELSERAKFTRECVLRQFWQSFVEDMENAIRTNDELSCAIALMDKIGGWENWVGSRFAASMWIYTNAVICDGQNHVQNLGTTNSGLLWKP